MPIQFFGFWGTSGGSASLMSTNLCNYREHEGADTQRVLKHIGSKHTTEHTGIGNGVNYLLSVHKGNKTMQPSR